MVERCCKHAHALVTLIGNLPGAAGHFSGFRGRGRLELFDLDHRQSETLADIFAKVFGHAPAFPLFGLKHSVAHGGECRLRVLVHLGYQPGDYQRDGQEDN